MDDNKYLDSDGIKCTFYQMVKSEPEWSANRIRVCEKLEADIERLLTDIDTKNGIIQLHQTIEAKLKDEIDELVGMLEMLMSSGLMENETQGYTYCEVTDEEYKTSLALIAKHR